MGTTGSATAGRRERSPLCGFSGSGSRAGQWGEAPEEEPRWAGSSVGVSEGGLGEVCGFAPSKKEAHTVLGSGALWPRPWPPAGRGASARQRPLAQDSDTQKPWRRSLPALRFGDFAFIKFSPLVRMWGHGCCELGWFRLEEGERGSGGFCWAQNEPHTDRTRSNPNRRPQGKKRPRSVPDCRLVPTSSGLVDAFLASQGGALPFHALGASGILF